MTFPSRVTLWLLLALAAAVLITAAVLRDPEYDEGYTAAVTSLTVRPAWPEAPLEIATMRAVFAPAPTPWAIADNLRSTDVHPPLYFWIVWAWRRGLGPDPTVTRLLSVIFSLGALALVAAIATEAAVPVAPALLLTLGCYGFVETAIVARSFALAQCLILAGLLLTLRGARARGGGTAVAAGVALGAASLTNYLAAFPAAAALLWLLIHRPRVALLMLAGMLPFLDVDFWFFLAQRNSRIGQFDPFAWAPMIAALGRALGGAVLGGLPLYFPDGAVEKIVSFLLALLLLAMLGLPILRWRHVGTPGARSLLAMVAVSAPFGLVLMGLAAGTIPVEIRYFAFALPPLALLISGALPTRWLLQIPVAVQAAALIGLMTHPATMQPEGAAARAAFAAVGGSGLALVPRGNDGVGLVSAFLSAAPDPLHILLVQPDTPLTLLCDDMRGWPKITAARLAVDRTSTGTLPLLRAALRSCDPNSLTHRDDGF